MATHRVLVQRQSPEGLMWLPGEEVDYSGQAHWTLEPLEARAKPKWLKDVADPERVRDANAGRAIAGVFREDENPLPAGTYILHNTRSYPPSGWQG
jgi:hypothetical protein